MPKASVLTTDDYYSPHRILSRNAMWNMVVGARGLGKTFAFKRWGVRNHLKTGEQFFYLRRYDTEQHGKETFFDDLREFFPDHEFRVNGNRGEIARRDNGGDPLEWSTCCWFGALSQAGNIKSIPYPLVTLLVFDEAIPNNLRFLPDEAGQFSELYSTIDRWKDKTRVVMLANAVTLANPYFARYRIDVAGQLARMEQFRTYCDGFFCVELADYGGFSTKVASTRFGRFITAYDEDYAQYAIGNTFQDGSEALVSPIPTTAVGSIRIHTPTMGEFGLYVDDTDGVVSHWISRRLPPPAERVTFDPHAVDEHTQLVSRSTPFIRRLRATYDAGALRFDTAAVKSSFQQLIGGLI